MAYSTSANVASEFRGLDIGASSLLTSTEVTRFIAEADAEIDGRLGLRYTVPITGSSALITVRQLSIWLTAHRVSRTLKIKTVSEEVNQGPAAPSLRDQAMALMKEITDGDLILSDASALSSSGGIASYNDTNDIEPEFEKGEDQY